MVGVHLHKILESAKPSGGTGERQLPGEGGRVGDTRKLRAVMDMTTLDGDEAFMGACVRQISQTTLYECEAHCQLYLRKAVRKRNIVMIAMTETHQIH